MRRPLITAMVVVGMPALAGCVPTSGPVAFRPAADAQMDALLEGTLRITADCVTVEISGEAFIPVFEIGDAHFGEGVLAYGNEYRDGDTIQVGGGTAPQAGDGWYVPAGCPDAQLWAAAPHLRPS